LGSYAGGVTQRKQTKGPVRIGPKRPVRVFLKEWRDKMGWTQEQLAARLNTSGATVSRKETVKRNHDLGYIAAVAEVMGKKPEDMFRHPDQPSAEELLRDVSPEGRQAIVAVIETLKRTGTR
jgi:transcriptional regulator with XRE-family HTH domain